METARSLAEPCGASPAGCPALERGADAAGCPARGGCKSRSDRSLSSCSCEAVRTRIGGLRPSCCLALARAGSRPCDLARRSLDAWAAAGRFGDHPPRCTGPSAGCRAATGSRGGGAESPVRCRDAAATLGPRDLVARCRAGTRESPGCVLPSAGRRAPTLTWVMDVGCPDASGSWISSDLVDTARCRAETGVAPLGSEGGPGELAEDLEVGLGLSGFT